MADASSRSPLPNWSLLQRWHRLRTSPRFPYLLFFGLLVAGGLSQVYCYWWGVRIQWMAARHGGNAGTQPLYPNSFKQTVGARFIEPLYGARLRPMSPLSASDMALLEGLWSFTVLTCDGPISTEAWQRIPRLSQLSCIALTGTRTAVLDADLEALSRLPQLRELEILNTALDTGGLRHFSRHPTLHHLVITNAMSWAQPFDQNLSRDKWPLAEQPASFSVEALRELGASQSLATLTISGCPEFKDDHLLALTSALSDGSKPLPRLKELCLASTGVTGRGLRQLSNLSNLVKLDLSLTDVTDSGLRELRSATSLHTLTLDHLPISESDIEILLALPNLQVLSVDTTELSEAVLLRLTEHRNLKWLMVSPNVSEETLIKLRTHFPCYVGGANNPSNHRVYLKRNPK